jgi:hypothetical protein
MRGAKTMGRGNYLHLLREGGYGRSETPSENFANGYEESRMGDR